MRFVSILVISALVRIQKLSLPNVKKKNVPIRIGINAGSLERELLEKYGGPCAEALVESAKRHVDILESMDFYDICLSFKSSNVELTIDAYELAARHLTTLFT